MIPHEFKFDRIRTCYYFILFCVEYQTTVYFSYYCVKVTHLNVKNEFTSYVFVKNITTTLHAGWNKLE